MFSKDIHFVCECSIGHFFDRIEQQFFDSTKTAEEKPEVFWYWWCCPDKKDENCLVVFPHAGANLLEMLSFHEDFQWETPLFFKIIEFLIKKRDI